MNAVDTNVLIYARDPRDPVKQAIAYELIANLEDGVLVWQVSCEYLSAIRKLGRFGIGIEDAMGDVREMLRTWRLTTPDWRVMEIAEDVRGRYSLSFWDSLLVAACIHAGVERLYTEDFDAYPRIDGLEIVNPFA